MDIGSGNLIDPSDTGSVVLLNEWDSDYPDPTERDSYASLLLKIFVFCLDFEVENRINKREKLRERKRRSIIQ